MLDFGLASYFDKVDVCEALAHELAAACMEHWPDRESELKGRLPFRELVGDPFDLPRRAVIPAITTLTLRLRRYPAKPSFLLHWRDPARVATAAGMYDVIPAGNSSPRVSRYGIGATISRCGATWFASMPKNCWAYQSTTAAAARQSITNGGRCISG
ncbi:hypothetical protein [Nocardia abscessus]|uniref:hypothetical protein n=1 Tax=Nocardia abscessus TaxID=120957 RepID=UPI002453FB1E|nr:hypothetical protein [Nocardia abscessus]